MYCFLKSNFVPSFIFCLIFSTILLFCSSKELSPQLLSDVGNWGPVEQCYKDTYVRGFQLKIEPVQNFEEDNTAINGIRFLCGKISDNDEMNEVSSGDTSILNKNGENTIQSLIGPWGTWGKIHYCSENQYAVGFQLNSQSSLGIIKKDKSGATNFRLICSSSGKNFEVVEGEGMDWGTWTDTQLCEKNQIICSIQTKVQVSIKDPSLKNCWHRESNGTVDQESLTNLKTSCCQLPLSNPGEICVPTESWKLIGECDNSELNFYEICNYVNAIGISLDTSSPDFDPMIFKVHNNLDFDMKTIAESLAKNFNSKIKGGKFNKATDFSWDNSTDEEIWELEKNKQVSFDLPPGYKVKVYQVVGKCGLYLVKTGRFHRIYSTINENGHPVEFDEYYYNSSSFNFENEILKKLNESIAFDLEEEMEIFQSAEFLTYLILGLIAGPICIGFITYFILKHCIKKYTDEELVSDSLSRTSTSANRDSSLVIKNMGSSSIEMERF